MFYYFKFAIRSLRRGGIYSVINISGMAVGLAACLLMMLWVSGELSYERFYSRADDICVAVGSFDNDGQTMHWTSTPAALASSARDEIAAVESACVVNMNYDLGFVEYEDCKFIGGNFIMADTTFFHIFENTFIEGSAATAFPDPLSVVITESMARKIFGSEPALGHQLLGGNGGDANRETYHVTGVVRDTPANTSLTYDAVFSIERSRHRNTWGRWAYRNYLLLHPGADKMAVSAQLCALHNRHDPKAEVTGYRLQSISDMRLHAPDGSETGIATVRLFSIIALALLLIACINYINLVTALAGKRVREMAVRRIFGAGRSSIFMQTMMEAAVLFAAAIMSAIFLVVAAAPLYEMLTGTKLHIPRNVPWMWVLGGALPVIIILLTGAYPSIRLAMSRPLDTSKPATGRWHHVFTLRKALVVMQFVATTVLIVGTIVLTLQMAYMRTKHPGYDREQVMMSHVFTNLTMRNNYQNFKNDLAMEPSVAGVTCSSSSIMNVGSMSNVIWEGMQDGRAFSIYTEGIDRNFFDMMQMRMIDGDGFTGTPADSARYFLNETAVRMMGIDSPVGKSINLPWRGKGVISGVVADFHFQHLSEPVAPMILYLQETPWTIYVRAKAGLTSAAIAAAERAWKKYDSDFPFAYQFMDEAFAEMYADDRLRERLFHIFAAIAILISCLGLFGLVTYTAESRTKEIGIRKVLGANVSSIVRMLTGEFLALAIIAMLIAFPLAYRWLDAMLQDYAYRVGIRWWMFAAAGAVTVILALLTVGWKAWRAATENPVKAIKSE